MTTVLLDTHALHWWSSESRELSPAAAEAIAAAEELAVSSITWFELAWLVQHGRIGAATPIRPWLAGLAAQVRTVGVTSGIAATAVELPRSFPNDPADRIIYATAIEYGWALVTRDERMRSHPHPHQITVW